MRRSLLLSVLLLAASRPDAAPAQDRPPGDHPAGLAARYPGDRGLRDDPAVLLFEDFDGVDLPSVVARWDSVGNAGGSVLALSEDVPAPAASGRPTQPPGHRPPRPGQRGAPLPSPAARGR